jgi:glycerol uptake facilitator-like aquaporin
MSDTVITCTVSPCTVVLQHNIPLLDMTPADALQVTAAIVGAWAVGFCFRVVIQLFHDGSSTTESE